MQNMYRNSGLDSLYAVHCGRLVGVFDICTAPGDAVQLQVDASPAVHLHSSRRKHDVFSIAMFDAEQDSSGKYSSDSLQITPRAKAWAAAPPYR